MTAPILFAADVTPLQDTGLYQLAYAAASPSRREKVDRFRFEKDKRLSLGAEALLRHALRSMGYSPGCTDFTYGPQNKPYLKNGSGYFNLSHAGIWAICAVAGCEIGCDVEQLAPIDLKLAEQFHPEECADIYRQPTEDLQLDLFYRTWTLKESFMKATGLGMTLPLNAFRILCGKTVSVIHAVDTVDYRFREFSDLPGYSCALCCAGSCTGAQLCILDMKELLLPEYASCR